MSSSPADLLPQARIRLAALELFGDQGFDKTTIRQIATRAGVSPGLVIHHYGSKQRLRDAVDEWVMDVLMSEKGVFIGGSVMPTMNTYLDEHPESRPILGYLITAMREGGDIAARAFDRMCDLTEQILDAGEAHGTMRSYPDRTAMVTLLVAYSMGLSMLGDQVGRRLGGGALMDPEPFRRYTLAAMDVFTHGLFTDDSYLRTVEAAFVPSDKEESHE